MLVNYNHFISVNDQPILLSNISKIVLYATEILFPKLIKKCVQDLSCMFAFAFSLASLFFTRATANNVSNAHTCTHRDRMSGAHLARGGCGGHEISFGRQIVRHPCIFTIFLLFLVIKVARYYLTQHGPC